MTTQIIVAVIWVELYGFYRLLGTDKKIPKEQRQANYVYSLHVFLVMAAVCEVFGLKLFLLFPTVNEVVGIAGLVFGFMIVVLAKYQLSDRWSVDIVKRERYEIETSRLYVRVRHPIYLGQIIMAFMTAVALANYAIMVLAAILYFINNRRARREDEFFLQEARDGAKGLEGYEEYFRGTFRIVPFGKKRQP
ncbi:isoprenylcysteine carboxylmethyltransferase family protein [Candidatus Saccharibacteria bacterium]|nr:isoprenylcysteine carboxylmethyltransferase family protein [Candidatus Saccharibacteria bacterium]